MRIERDPHTGYDTTGHEWDGIKELNTPVPKVVIWSYCLTIAFCVGYWVLYPAFPYVTDFTRGVLGYSSRTALETDIQNGISQKTTFNADLVKGDLTDLVADPQIRAKYEKSAAVLFRDNCAACHGSQLKGQTGFPNLKDNHWLWSGDVEEIEATIRYGINSGDEDERIAEMLGFGKNGLLDRSEVSDVVQFVLSISSQNHDPAMSARGAVIFEENCSACHGESGEGGLESGAPSLIDKTWIYGSGKNAVFETVWSGRKGVMPAWVDRLDNADIRKLTLYLKWQGDGSAQ